MRLITQIGEWFDLRLKLAAPIRDVAEHPVPRNTASWWYVFGSAALIVFCLQLATGILLALVYVPSADQAYQSLVYLNYEAPLGWYLRAMHFWGSNAMVAVMTLHMIQVFLFGAHKYPREMTWVVGVLLFLCTLGMAFTGQILRWVACKWGSFRGFVENRSGGSFSGCRRDPVYNLACPWICSNRRNPGLRRRDCRPRRP